MNDNNYVECPYCCEMILAKAIKCKHCFSDLAQKAESTDDMQDITMQIKSIKQALSTNSDRTNKFIGNYSYSLILGAVSIMLLFIPLFSLSFSGFGLIIGIIDLKRSKNKSVLAGVVLCSIVLIIGLVISLSSCIEVVELRQLQSSQRSLSGQISSLRDTRMDLEREKNSIQRLIDEHERISNYTQLSSFNERRLKEISNDLLRYSRYINYRIDSSGAIFIPTLNDQLDNRIKEIRLQELELENELAFIEFELHMKELK